MKNSINIGGFLYRFILCLTGVTSCVIISGFMYVYAKYMGSILLEKVITYCRDYPLVYVLVAAIIGISLYLATKWVHDDNDARNNYGQ